MIDLFSNPLQSYETVDSELRQAQTGASVGYMACACAMEASASRSAGPGTLAVQHQAARQPTIWQVILSKARGLAVNQNFQGLGFRVIWRHLDTNGMLNQAQALTTYAFVCCVLQQLD